MTVLTKPSAIIKKPEITKAPLVEKGVVDEEKLDLPGPEFSKRGSQGMLCLTLTILLLLLVGFTIGMMLCKQILGSPHRRFGLCSIVIPNDIRELENNHVESHFRVLPLQWPQDVEIISTGDEDTSDEFVNALREELDIEDMVEKISVFNDGQRVDFIHDFNDNTTSIIDISRCFITELHPALVLPPAQLSAELQRGGAFDVSRVRSSLRALLPAAAESAPRLPQCAGRPVYWLHEDGLRVRKRSADAASPQYVQFAGRHVQEIRIHNLRQLLAHERRQL